MSLSEFKYDLEIWWLKIRKYARVGLFAAALGGFVLAAFVLMFGPVSQVPASAVTIQGVYVGENAVVLFAALMTALFSVWLAKALS